MLIFVLGAVAAPLTAASVGNVVRATIDGFVPAAVIGCVWTCGSQTVKRAPLGVAWKAGLTTAQRWGRISGGFSGGKAAGQALRLPTERWQNLFAAAVTGVAAAESLSAAPMSVATFVAFSAVLDGMAPREGSAPEKSKGGDRSLASARADALAKARADYERRHKDDPVRMRALKG